MQLRGLMQQHQPKFNFGDNRLHTQWQQCTVRHKLTSTLRWVRIIRLKMRVTAYDPAMCSTLDTETCMKSDIAAMGCIREDEPVMLSEDG